MSDRSDTSDPNRNNPLTQKSHPITVDKKCKKSPKLLAPSSNYFDYDYYQIICSPPALLSLPPFSRRGPLPSWRGPLPPS